MLIECAEGPIRAQSRGRRRSKAMRALYPVSLELTDKVHEGRECWAAVRPKCRPRLSISFKTLDSLDGTPSERSPRLGHLNGRIASIKA